MIVFESVFVGLFGHYFDRREKSTVMDSSHTLKMIRIGAQTGRSMVEMLGVLAVVGVLSISAVAGYRVAMEYYRSNDILNEVTLRSVDTKGVYMGKELPLELSEEWANTTASGYPIDVVTFPPKVFEVRVEDVSSDVCKRVLEMDFQDDGGAVYVADENDESVDLISRQEYIGDTSICGSDTTKQMIFITTTDELSEGISFCLGSANCTDCETCVDNICQTKEGYEASYEGICDDGKKKCCPKGYGLNTETCGCEEIPEVCETNQFRLASGLCEDCGKGYNRIILNEVFTFPGVNVKDTQTGVDMCNACSGRQPAIQDTKTGVWWCPYTCVNGITFKTTVTDGTMCHPCDETRAVIDPNDSFAASQCLACGENYIWWRNYKLDIASYCGPEVNCTSGEQMKQYPNDCIDCPAADESIKMGRFSLSDLSIWSNMAEQCNACPNHWAGEEFVLADDKVRYCYGTCSQPENGGEICKTDPSNEACTRKWQNFSGDCLSCDYSGEITSITHDGTSSGTVISKFQELCEACGRRVNSAGSCVLNSDNVPAGQFMGANGVLYDCAELKGITVESDELSGCTTNCRKAENGNYLAANVTGGTAIREMYKNYCVSNPCPSGKFYYDQMTRCENCPTKSGMLAGEYSLNSCFESCENVVIIGRVCVVATCADSQFRGSRGRCIDCEDASESVDMAEMTSDYVALCNQCNNRIAINQNSSGGNGYCVTVEPGTWGICNSGTLIPTGSHLSATLRNQAQSYLKGVYDGKLFMSQTGQCYECDTKSDVATTQSQCAMCSNRRYSNNTCYYGLCSDGSQFLNNSKTCVDCGTTTKTQIPHDSSAHASCNACNKNRAMIVEDKSYCVNECEPKYFQSAAGVCLSCDTVGEFEIGSDTVSQDLCSDCGKTPICITDDAGVKTCVCE